MQFVSILPLAMGIFIASQTAINSRLTSHNHLPLVTSTISFATGSLFLGILTLCSGQGLGIRLEVILDTPWWSWLGGLTAAFALTCNILLFKHLGSVETTLYPVIGQIIMSLVIDQFGWFGSLQQRMTWHKGLGLVFLIAGLLIFINLVNFHRTVKEADAKLSPQLGWQLLGIFAGVALAIQNAVNARLGQAFHSPLHAAFLISSRLASHRSLPFAPACCVCFLCGQLYPAFILQLGSRGGDNLCHSPDPGPTIGA